MTYLRLQSLLEVLVLTAVCMMGTGCASMYALSCHGGYSKTVTIRTEPSGADLWYEGTYIGKSPCELYIDLKKLRSISSVGIEKDGIYIGHLQVTGLTGDQDTFQMYLGMDFITIIPLCIDIALLPIHLIHQATYDHATLEVIYDGKIIQLDKIEHGKTSSNQTRWISPYDSSFIVLPKGAVFYGFDKSGFYYYKRPLTREEQQARDEVVNAVVNGANQFLQQMQQISQQQYQPPPSPAPRPTPAAPEPTNTQRTVTPTTPNFKRFCPRTYKSGGVHGEWDSRTSVGCPACRGTINW